MENDILDSLNDLGYEGPLTDETAFAKALEGGPKSLEFTKLVHILAEELKKLCQLEETVNMMNNPDESSAFLLELSSFLKELGCPYKKLVIGHMSARLQSKEDRLLLLDYLISELMAARMSKVDGPKDKSSAGMDIIMQESPTAKDLKDILISLKFNKPPPNITPEMLFSKLEAKLKDTIQKEGDQLVGKPLYNKAVSEKEWKQIETNFSEMFEEYRLRRETLITRLECTIQSFEWSERLKNKKDVIQSAYRPKKAQLKVKPDVKLSDFLAARSSLLTVEKTSSATVRKNTQSDVNKVIIGQVSGLALGDRLANSSDTSGTAENENGSAGSSWEDSFSSTSSPFHNLFISPLAQSEDCGHNLTQTTPESAGNNFLNTSPLVRPIAGSRGGPLVTTSCTKVPESHTAVSVGSSSTAVPQVDQEKSCNTEGKRRLCQAARKRFRKLMQSDMSVEEALVLCRKPWNLMMAELPPQTKVAVKRGLSGYKSPQIQPTKCARIEPKDNQMRPKPIALAKSLRVSIHNSVPMSEDQMRLVHRALNLAILAKFCGQEAKRSVPKFASFSQKSGWILVTCVNEESQEWLIRELVNVKPWPEAELIITSEDDVPRPRTCTLYVPFNEVDTVEQAMALLRAQNEGLNTELWTIHHQRKESNGILVTFSPDDASMESLRATDGRAYLGFKVVLIRMNGGSDADPLKATPT